MSEALNSIHDAKRLSRKEKNELLRKQFQVENEAIDDEDLNESPVTALVSSHRSVPSRPQAQEQLTVSTITTATTVEEHEIPELAPEVKGPRVQGITIYPSDQEALDALMTFAIENKLGVGRAGPSLFYSAGLHAIKALIQSDPSMLRTLIKETAEQRGQGDRRIKRMERR